MKDIKDIIIRRARTADMAAVKQLVRAHPKELMQDRLPQPGMSFVAVTAPGKIVGFCGLDPSQTKMAELRTIVVDKRYRRRGIAGMLVTACEELPAKKGIWELFAVTGAKSFFSSVEYKPLPAGQAVLFKKLKKRST